MIAPCNYCAFYHLCTISCVIPLNSACVCVFMIISLNPSLATGANLKVGLSRLEYRNFLAPTSFELATVYYQPETELSESEIRI